MFTCSICDETFCENPTCSTLCGHVFHSNCILQWLERNNSMFIDLHSKFHNEISNKSSLHSKIYLLTSLLIERKQNCPQCRAVVLRDDLIKLFLVDNPGACILQNNNIEQELSILKNQLKKLQEDKKDNEKSILNLQKESQNLRSTVSKKEATVKHLKMKCNNKKETIHDLRIKFAQISIDFKNSQELILCSQKQCQLEQIKNMSLEKDLHEIQSINSIVIDKLNAEIADLKSEKAYLQGKCCSLEKQNKLPSSSEIKIVNEHMLLHDNEIQNTFCGHDPKLTLPSKKFLLGCVFLFIGDRNQFEDICSDTFMFKLNIIEHGGSVEQSYSSRVTHLICVTQKHQLVEQGLRDRKRCVTNYWLNDIIVRKCLLPPWLAYHFPLPYSDENNLPCHQFQIAITNFEQNDYHIVSAMVKLTGAYVVNLISSNTDVVVTKNLSGDIINTAFAFKRPVVNVQWLNDILFGAINGIKNPKNIKYQQFSLSNPFLVNYDMVSHLMEAWKSPVVFLQNNEVYDLTESSADSSMCKRQKTNSIENEIIDLLDDESSSNDLFITYVNFGPKKKTRVLFCGFETEVEEELKQIVMELGGEIATNYHEGTHLVMNKPSKTLQFLSCLSTINYIVGEPWIRISRLLKKFDDEKDYQINKIFDNLDGVNYKIICDVQRVLQNSERQKLFEHKIFHITPGIEFPTSDCLEQMIRSAGGTIEKEMKNMFKKRPPNTYFIISCLKDLNLIENILEIKPFLYKSDFIMDAIMQQHISVNQNYLLVQ